MDFETFKAHLTTPTPYKMSESEKESQIKSYEFTFTKYFIVFPDKLKEIHALHLIKEHSINRVTISDYDKYVSIIKLPILHPERTKFSRFQIQFENGNNLNLIMNKWNTLKMKLIHGKYWLLSDGRWLVTFLASIAAIIISIIALSNKC